ncbi:MAG: hypothetical protein KKH95_14075 [Gammaproteobacteria bacterium]|nr:hypothetical protein [Gammaproteobacteria bacterium]
MKLYWLSLIAFGLFSGRFVYADDTEIYRNTTNRINPNVIFLIDTSGSMAYEAANNTPPETGELTRIDIVKNSAIAAINKLSSSEPINIAIMRFDTTGNAKGGLVTRHFTPTDTAANKKLLTDELASMNISNIGGGTPLTEAFEEAALYMRGKEPAYGTPAYGSYKSVGTTYKESGNYLNYIYTDTSSIGSTATSVRNVGSWGNPSYLYNSPVTATCQKNHIVLFTDGAPSSDSGSDDRIKDLIQNMTFPSGSDLEKDCDYHSCAEEFAYWLQHTDHFKDSTLTGKSDPNAAEIDQNIYVHTVGGFSGISQDGKDLLDDIAKYGHPLTAEHLKSDGTSKHYYSASDEAGLTKALTEVFGGISNSAGNFAAPVVAVNAFNSLEHRDELYYSVFQPAEIPGWSGNIKRYRMNSKGEILDSNNIAAIDPATGFFKDSSQSFWTLGSADGSVVTKGGMANRLSADRKIYTRLSGYGDIVSTSNLVHESNSNITSTMLDDFLPTGYTVDNTARTNILKWARGIDPSTGDARKTMADPLHGNPVLITYRDSPTETSDVLYTGTNVGYIHALNPDATTPGELWAFIPKELLPNLAVYQQGTARFLKAYGIDGQLSIYHNDINADRIIDSSETAYLAAGMRRGGSSYYLLDISKKTAPKLVSQINSGDSGFEELGQTWSKMTSATVMWKGIKTPVFFFGGGYDRDEDNAKTRITHDKGNAIYMVKATTDSNGKAFDLLWKVTGRSTNSQGLSLSDMKSSFAGDLTLVDNDGNGTVDLIYAADVGGRIWRFDIDSGNTSANSFATGGIIADFNDGTESGNIRFYTQPDVVYTDYGLFESVDPNDPTNVIAKKEGRYQITIGSGFRAGPLSTSVKDKVFVINDFDISAAPASSYSKKSVTDLANYKNFSSASYTQKHNGFYYELTRSGEKVLSTTLTVNNVVYIPTFRPSDSTVNIGCEPDAGQASLIKIEPLSSPQTTERKVTTTDLNQGGIVPKPILVFPPADPTTKKPSEPVIAIGTEITPVSGDFNAFQQTYWKEN